MIPEVWTDTVVKTTFSSLEGNEEIRRKAAYHPKYGRSTQWWKPYVSRWW